MNKYKIPHLSDLLLLPKNRKEASLTKNTYYFTNILCKHGHIDMRNTRNGCCRSCNNRLQLESSKIHHKKRKLYRNANRQHLNEKALQHRQEFPEIHQNVNKKYRSKNPTAIKHARDIFRKNNPEKILADVNNRRAQKIKATPSWADHKKIINIYKEARELIKINGLQYHVDHIIPLVNPIVCGLHYEANLQIILATENLKKSNKYDSI